MGWIAKGLLLLATAYSAFWSVFVALGWLGLAPAQLGTIDTAGALSFVPVWTRIALFIWTALLCLGLWLAWKGRRRAWLVVLIATGPHLLVFLQLSANPYYNGLAGYLNFAVEFLIVVLLAERVRRQRLAAG